MLKIDRAKVGTDTQIDDDIHRLLWDGSSADFDNRVSGHSGSFDCPCGLVVVDPGDISVCARSIFKSIDREAAPALGVASLVGFGYRGSRLLEHAPDVRVELGDGVVVDDEVVGRVEPGITMIKRRPTNTSIPTLI